MIEIEAVYISAPVFGRINRVLMTGITHGVFRHAVNLLNGEELITLIDERRGNMPNGISCRFGKLNPLDLFRCGATFILTKNAVRFPSLNLVVHLDSAEIWQPASPTIDTTLSDMRTARMGSLLLSLKDVPASLPHLNWLAQSLNGFAVVPSGAPSWVSRFSAQIKQLQNSTINLDWFTAEEAASGLLGLGIGLTPSGDDFLAGFLTAGLAFGPRAPFEHLAFSMAQRAPVCTTLVSAALLHALSQNHLSERFGNLLAAISDRSNVLEVAMRNMLEFGLSSGLETMYGLLYGIQAVEKVQHIKPV